MKNLLIFLCFLHITAFANTKTDEQRFDKRIETLSIVFRLAGNNEYNRNDYQSYAKSIQQHFEPYKQHPLIAYAQKIREENGIGYDAVMSMAVHLSNKESFKLLKEKQNSLDERWAKVDVQKFISLLNDFYKTSHCDDFFESQKDNYQKTEENFNALLKDFDQSWYAKYYGTKPTEQFKILLGYGIGGNNYGPRLMPVNQNPIVYAIMGVWQIDQETDLPFFKKESYLPTLIHEFNHSFINHLLEIDNIEKQLQEPGEVILNSLRKEMNAQAYNDWKTVINESLVRASVIRYLMDHNSEEKIVKGELQEQLNRGFLWTKELVELLGKYESQRTQYPTFESFYPVIIDFFKQTAKNIETLKSNYEALRPKVISIEPFANNAENVDSNIKELVINFSKEMLGKGVSINFSDRGKEFFPLKKNLGYFNNNQSLKLQVELKPNKEYEFILMEGLNFKSADGYPLQEYKISFKTK